MAKQYVKDMTTVRFTTCSQEEKPGAGAPLLMLSYAGFKLYFIQFFFQKSIKFFKLLQVFPDIPQRHPGHVPQAPAKTYRRHRASADQSDP